MGYYIQGPTTGKAQYIVSEYDGKIIPRPKLFSEVPSDKAIICVLANGPFDAAGYCFDEKEFIAFSDPEDMRRKTWLVIDRNKAEELSGYNK